ncbi:MAG TPA: glutathione S-transferase family protein [Candidatus Binatia bacterium]
MLELYQGEGSVCARKVRIALAEKGITDWVGHMLDLNRGDQNTPEYLKLNPKAVVPTLVHDGHIIPESTVICEYLEDVFPEPHLRPADPVGAAMMRKWAKIPDEEIHVSCAAISSAGLLGRARRKNTAYYLKRLAESPDRARAERARGCTLERWKYPEVVAAVLVHEKLLKNMEKELAANGPWLVGKMYTLADIGLTPYLYRLVEMGLSGMWADRRHVADWVKRVMERPSFESAILKYPGRYMDDAGGEEDKRDWAEVQKIVASA